MSDDSGYPTRLDRFAQWFTVGLAALPLVVLGPSFARDGEILPLLVVLALVWANLYLMYLLYRWRRRTDLRLEQADRGSTQH